MMLRASSQATKNNFELDAITSGNESTSGVPLGNELVAFAEAVYSRDPEAIADAREVLLTASDERTVVDAAGVAANFHRMTRVADGTGIPVDQRMLDLTEDVRDRLGLHEYESARNTFE